MKIIRLNEKYLKAFIEFCQAHEKEHDESFLSESDLVNFKIEDDITFIAVKDQQIYGVFSVMLKWHGRVRIFLVIENDYLVYEQLHESMMSTLINEQNLRAYNLYIPEVNFQVMDIYKKLGLYVERYIYVLERDITSVNLIQFPNGFELREMKLPEEAEVWSRIRNLCFASLEGFVPYTKEDIIRMCDDTENIKNGNLILWYGTKPVGIVKVVRDVQKLETLGFIGPIAVLPDYQGKGLGKNLLRSVVELAIEVGPWRSSLCVNAKNENALKLYTNEGFYKSEVVVAMKYEDLKA